MGGTEEQTFEDSRIMSSKRRAERKLTDWQTKSVDNWLKEHFPGDPAEDEGEGKSSLNQTSDTGDSLSYEALGDNMILHTVKDKQGGCYFTFLGNEKFTFLNSIFFLLVTER